MRVGAPRIRQLRVKENTCRVYRRRRVKHIITHCRDDYNWFDDNNTKKLFDRMGRSFE